MDGDPIFGQLLERCRRDHQAWISGEWQRTHRQADPLVERRSFDDVLALLVS